MDWLTIFVGMLVLDFVWAQYTTYLHTGAAVQASVYAGAISLLSGVVTTGYIHDIWLLVPTTAGAVVGTYLSVVWNKRTSGLSGLAAIWAFFISR